jgi:hypothetical protein
MDQLQGQVGGFRATHRTWWRNLSNELAPMDKGNGEEQVTLRSKNQYHSWKIKPSVDYSS